MRSLHATSFRVLLVLATVLFSLLPALFRQLGLNDDFFVILLWCPGLFFVPVVLFSIRPSPFHALLPFIGALLFVLLVCGSSFLAVVIATNTAVRDLEWLAWSAAGSLGAVLTLAAMRFFLRYRVVGLLGWLLPPVAASLSQLMAFGLLNFGFSKFAIAPYFFPPTILWWWFVGESLLFQQRHSPLLSNQPLHPDALTRAGERRR